MAKRGPEPISWLIVTQSGQPSDCMQLYLMQVTRPSVEEAIAFVQSIAPAGTRVVAACRDVSMVTESGIVFGIDHVNNLTKGN